MVLLALTICIFLIIPTSITLAETTVLDRPEERPAENTELSTLGNLYRKARQSRCIRCYDDRTYPPYESRYGYSQYSSGGGAAPPARGLPPYRPDYEDKNWYPYPDRHDTRARYDERYPERYDDRYSPRTYDRYDYRSNYDRYDTRGYEGRDRYYDRPNEGYYPDRYDRNRGGYEGRYTPDRDAYDRYPSRGGYDYKNYRPWDETYSPPYGPRPRPLGGSYLHDRDSNTPVTVQPMNTDGKTGEQPKDSDAGSMDNSKTPNATNDSKTN